jgi:hypothetical protein
MTAPDKSRRDFVKRGAYVAPAILTLAAAPEFAKAGSVKPPKDPRDNGHGRGPKGPKDKPPKDWP